MKINNKLNDEIEEIKTIGDEVFFQLDYYNKKHLDKPMTFYREDMENSVCKFAAEKYMELTGKKLDNSNGYYKGFSYDTIYNMKQGNVAKNQRDKTHKEVNSMNTYYVIIFCMLKVIGILDDYEIFLLLKRYNIQPKKEEDKKLINDLKQRCRIEYVENKKKKAVEIWKYVEYEERRVCRCICGIKTEYIIDFCNTYNESDYLLLGQDTIEEYKTGGGIKLNKIKQIIKEAYSKLSKMERKKKSLDLHKPSCFLDDLLNDEIRVITLETVLYIMEDLSLVNTDIYYFVNRVIMEDRNTYKETNLLGALENI